MKLSTILNGSESYVKVKVHRDTEREGWLVSIKMGKYKRFGVLRPFFLLVEAIRFARELAMAHGCELIVERESI